MRILTAFRSAPLGVRIVFVGLFLSVVFVAYVFGCVFITLFFEPARSDFDAGWWRWSRTCRCTPIRQQMAPDLVGSGRLTNLTRDEVLTLLGKPYPGDMWGDRRRFLAWRLGPAPGWLDDGEWLVIEFDADDRVTGLRIGVE